MTKFDKIIVASVFLVAMLLYMGRFLPQPSSKLHLLISIKGNIVCDWILDEHEGESKSLDLEGGKAEAVIDGGAVYLRSEVDFCPKKICVHSGKISRSGETIICAPNQLLIKLSAENSKIDAISR